VFYLSLYGVRDRLLPLIASPLYPWFDRGMMAALDIVSHRSLFIDLISIFMDVIFVKMLLNRLNGTDRLGFRQVRHPFMKLAASNYRG
jgi:hypothetical protein